MAYLKYKELTKYFYFSKKLEIESLPKYVTDYVFEQETILAAYKTKRDKGIFTSKKIVLFDVTPISNTKQVHIIPYNSISTIAVLFRDYSGQLLIYTDSGYPVNLKFIKMNSEDKTELRKLYSEISKKIVNK